MPNTMRRNVRRGLLAFGGTLLAGAVAGKYLTAAGAGALTPSAPSGPIPQPLGALRAHAPAPLPPLGFVRADGSTAALVDYAGRGVVLNFWATWCAPCVAEMPALDALAGAARGRGIVVLAVSEDHGGASAVQSFYAQHHITGLPVLLDAHMQAMGALRLDGIPTTLVIDRRGREVARIQGAVQWGAAESAEMIARLVG